MALQATHLLIARDLLPRLRVANSLEYYSGTLYPDSRYATGLSRIKTHGASCPNVPEIEKADFQKGWAIHLRYDDLGGTPLKTFIPHGLRLTSLCDEAWAAFMAAKIVEDLACAKRLDKDLALIQSIPCPKSAPLKENHGLLQSHYAAVRRLYSKGVPLLKDYEAHFTRLPDAALAVKSLLRHVDHILSSDRLSQRVEAVYGAVSGQLLTLK